MIFLGISQNPFFVIFLLVYFFLSSGFCFKVSARAAVSNRESACQELENFRFQQHHIFQVITILSVLKLVKVIKYCFSVSITMDGSTSKYLLFFCGILGFCKLYSSLFCELAPTIFFFQKGTYNLYHEIQSL